MRFAALAYGLVCYVLAVATVAYGLAFVANLFVAKSIDGPTGSGLSLWALLIDEALLLVFGLQHSLMARRAFKDWWTRLVPAPIERSTYVLASSAALVLLCWFWQPAPEVMWHVSHDVPRAILHGAAVAGLLLAAYSTFLIDHFDLLGLKQVWCCWAGRRYEPPAFQTPGLYRYVRHPMMLGILLALWSSPTMTAGRLAFAGALTAYILIGIAFEERELVRQFGEKYRQYQRRAGMLVPLRWRHK
ncbi:MAG: isoprenylcysteine carboxylmethyltransferase family protein [Planctomycetia bacterium]|nr:isoprenylcysteine carboxylmethyltransferase family protein [Planctomycetia bacterium]